MHDSSYHCNAMEKSAVCNILKWVLAALIAGFIGQFVRSLALRIIERHKRRASSQRSSSFSQYCYQE